MVQKVAVVKKYENFSFELLTPGSGRIFFQKKFRWPFFQFSEKFWQKKHHDLIIIKFSVLSVLEFLVLVLNFSHRKFPQEIISDILKLKDDL